VAEEEAGVAGGTEVADVDIFREEAGGSELRAVGFAEIEADIFRRRLMARRLHVEPLERIGFFAGARFVEIAGGIRKLCGEFGDEIGRDFVAAGANGGADRREEIGGLAAKFELHAADGFLGDADEGAAPTSVNGGDRAFFRIDKEYRHAIGGLDAEQETGAVCGGSIAFAGAGGGLGEKANHV
jgi:hypothetical protein